MKKIEIKENFNPAADGGWCPNLVTDNEYISDRGLALISAIEEKGILDEHHVLVKNQRDGRLALVPWGADCAISAVEVE
jgi:hypothetical protein